MRGPPPPGSGGRTGFCTASGPAITPFTVTTPGPVNNSGLTGLSDCAEEGTRVFLYGVIGDELLAAVQRKADVTCFWLNMLDGSRRYDDFPGTPVGYRDGAAAFYRRDAGEILFRDLPVRRGIRPPRPRSGVKRPKRRLPAARGHGGKHLLALPAGHLRPEGGGTGNGLFLPAGQPDDRARLAVLPADRRRPLLRLLRRARRRRIGSTTSPPKTRTAAKTGLSATAR